MEIGVGREWVEARKRGSIGNSILLISYSLSCPQSAFQGPLRHGPAISHAEIQIDPVRQVRRTFSQGNKCSLTCRRRPGLSPGTQIIQGTFSVQLHWQGGLTQGWALIVLNSLN